ncbi:MAG TPA: DUF6049 family protein, partial [Ruania sp.]|nr:DUF6049 family protein [Ruania sp.]
TVTNTTEEELSDPVVRLRLQTYVPSSRSALAAWNISGSSYSPIVLRAHHLGEDLAPGKSATFSFEIPAKDSPFSEYSEWGPRGVAVTATSEQVRDAQRTSVLWYPEDDPIESTTELTVVAPLTATSQEWTRAVNQGESVATAAADRLAPVVRKTRQADLSWALDPALLDDGPLGEDALAALADTGQTGEAQEDAAEQSHQESPKEQSTGEDTDSPPPAEESTDQEKQNEQDQQGEQGQQAQQDGQDGEATLSPQNDQQQNRHAGTQSTTGEELTEMITDGASGRDVVALAYGDADPYALSSSEDNLLLDAAGTRAQELFAGHEIQPIEDLLWPARYDLESLTALAERGIRSVILPASSQDPLTPLTYSPSNRSRVDTDSGELEAALSDTQLSAIFDSSRTPVQMRQALLAETAVIAREHPADARGFLAALPRDIGADADQLNAILDTLSAVQQAPWLELTNMRSLLGRAAPGIEREPLPDIPLSQPVLNSREVSDLTEAWSGLQAYTTITSEDEQLFGSLGSNILSAFSTTLAAAPQTQSALVSSSTTAVDRLSSAIQVESGSTVNLISSSGEIPIAVQSALHVPVTVTVQLVPEDPRLQATDVVKVRLDPDSGATARIPVRAVSNGNVEVHAEVLTAPDGDLLADGEPFGVRVRADWESTGTVIVAAVLVVGFVIGLVRTIRRGRRSQARRRAAALHSSPASSPSQSPSESPGESDSPSSSPEEQN